MNYYAMAVWALIGGIFGGLFGVIVAIILFIIVDKFVQIYG